MRLEPLTGLAYQYYDLSLKLGHDWQVFPTSDLTDAHNQLQAFCNEAERVIVRHSVFSTTMLYDKSLI